MYDIIVTAHILACVLYDGLSVKQFIHQGAAQSATNMATVEQIVTMNPLRELAAL